MAKKKDFSNIVDESFEEGYNSEPELETPAVEPAAEAEVVAEPVVYDLNEEELKKLWEKKGKGCTSEECGIFLNMLLSGNEKARNVVVEYEERSTYYLTDVHRACIDIVSHNEGLKKNEVVVAALNAYFSEEIKSAAREHAVTMAIKKLERELGK